MKKQKNSNEKTEKREYDISVFLITAVIKNNHQIPYKL